MESCGLYPAGTAPGCGSIDLNIAGNGEFVCDLNDWRWDGNRFLVRPVNGALSNSSPSSSEEVSRFVNGSSNGWGSGAGIAEKRKRVVAVDDDDEQCDTNANVSAVGEGVNGTGDDEERAGKKGKAQGNGSSKSSCQVQGCGADLSGAKDYHRRHKVCETHAKASTAIVGNAIQRFCQQCSRFHLLQEFDEGKRSCRRRLAGHNRRRRKTQPEVTSGNSLGDGTNGYLLISLLKVLANTHSESSERSRDQDMLISFLRGLVNLAGSIDTTELSRLLQESQNLQKHDKNAEPSPEAANGLVPYPAEAGNSLTPYRVAGESMGTVSLPANAMEGGHNQAPCAAATGSEPCKARFLDFDLNETYTDTDESQGGGVNIVASGFGTNDSPDCPSWMLQDSTRSPPQVSGNTDSTSTHSLSSSNGDAQCRTDRMIIKLLNKEPHDLPVDLRLQILNWLNNSPTDMESYIRPGCVILILYLRLAESNWTMLRDNLSSHLRKLVDTDNLWRQGLIYAMVQQQMSFVYNGQIMLNESLSLRQSHYCKILSVKPVAVCHSATVAFSVMGYNIVRPSSRILCSFEGKYLFGEETVPLSGLADHGGPPIVRFSCSLPNSVGRGFIEIEDNGFNICFFPFIVAEQELCSEISMLEDVIEPSWNSHGNMDESIDRNRALDFLNELGWLLQRVNIKPGTQELQAPPDTFHLNRFRWLISFAMNHDWSMVVKKLLDILFGGSVELNGKSPREIAISENLLHSAVRRRCKPMVELLLRYQPDRRVSGIDKTIFKPDAPDHLKCTPLHIAAASIGAEDLLDVLTDDPAMVGITAWKSARDINSFTPEDYARRQGHRNYLLLVQRKINQKMEGNHVVVGIPTGAYPVIVDGVKPESLGFEISTKPKGSSTTPYCSSCRRQQAYQNLGACRTSGMRTFLYRPALFTMVGIAVVCVCVGLLLRSTPRVRYVIHSFRWELLKGGPI